MEIRVSMVLLVDIAIQFVFLPHTGLPSVGHVWEYLTFQADILIVRVANLAGFTMSFKILGR